MDRLSLRDNYIYCFSWDHGALVIDPTESEIVLDYLGDRALTMILNTHHHGDHTAGNSRLKEETGCLILGPEDGLIPSLDRVVKDQEVIEIGPYQIEVIGTPGHTKGHVAYYVAKEKALFSGDLLFISGCGRLFEGTADEMFVSLQKIKKLPPETRLYCAHEYSEHNLRFAEGLTAESKAAKDRLKKGPPYVPSTLREEMKYNPFLRAKSSEDFKKLRELRDLF
jgi:hydroxyacylglutathione hydrolase